MNYVNPEYYDPSTIVDDIVANCDVIVFFDAASSDYATIVANEVHTFTPSITKVAHDGGFKAEVAALDDAIEPDNTGDVNHWAMLDTVSSKVLSVGETNTFNIVAGEKFDTSVFASKYPAIVAG